MSKLKIFAIFFTAVIGLTSVANAATTTLATDDFVVLLKDTSYN